MIALQLRVIAQGIEVISSQELVSGSVDIYTAEFEFNDAWSGFAKTALFDFVGQGEPTEIVLTDNSCVMPHEPLENFGYLRVGVCGVNGTQVMPTVWTELLQIKEGAVAGSIHIEPTGTTYEQVMAILAGIDGGTGGQILAKQSDVDYDFKWVDNPAQYVPGTEGDVVIIGSNNNIVDGGFKATEAFPVGSASGGIATIEDGADGVPVKSMTVQIEPNQKASINDASPTNILPINGWTSFNVNCSKKNLWGGAKLKEQLLTYVPSGVYDDENHTFDFSASASVVYNQKAGRIGFVWIPFKENTRYTFILTLEKTANAGLNLNAVYTDGTSVVIPGVATPGTKQTFVYTTPANKTLFYIGKRNSGGHTILHLDECGVFEGVLTADDFVSYNGNTYEIEFPDEAGTVYGGELVVNEDGSGTLTKTMDIVKVGDITWTKSGDYFRSNAKNSVIKANSPAYCSMYPVDFDSPISDGYIGVGLTAVSSSYYLMVRDSSRSSMTAADWKSAFSDMEIVYTLKTPVVYQLTAEKVISTLYGLNNIWADTGDIAVEYHADPTIFVEEKTKAIKQSIAPVEDGYTASQAYAVGAFLYVGDTLYKVTSAIASGATITPGTNCTATTVAEQLMALA